MAVILTLLFIAGILGLIYPKILRCQTRKIPLLLLFSFFIGLVLMSVPESVAEREKQLAALKQENPVQYLEALRDISKERWLKELKELDPKQHKVEIARIQKEEAEQKQWELEMQEYRKQQALEAPKNELCKNSNARRYAYIVVLQPAIEKRLKSPSSADFPFITSIKSGYADECSFVFVGYVDAQNWFSAMLRTKYHAKVTRDPKHENMWKTDFVKFL